MTLGRADLADTLRMLARLCEEADSAPPAPPVGIDEQAYKDALLAVSRGGVCTLQRALGVKDDGIVGTNTRGALANVDLASLMRELQAGAAPPPSADPKSGLTDELREEYRALYAAAEIRPERAKQVASIAARVKTAEARPDVVTVSTNTGVPARIICIMQALEANLDFNCHLHNGDPLTRRTVNVPAGRPLSQPPFSWSTSALDALHYHNLHEWADWSIEGAAYVFERYNGWGYRLHHSSVKSPYLWSFSTVYSSGKYVEDGKFAPDAISAQCGALTMLKALGGI